MAVMTHIELSRLSNDGRWIYRVWADNHALPERGFAYHSPEHALEAAQREARDFVPPPPGPSWEERLEALKQRLQAD